GRRVERDAAPVARRPDPRLSEQPGDPAEQRAPEARRAVYLAEAFDLEARSRHGDVTPRGQLELDARRAERDPPRLERRRDGPHRVRHALGHPEAPAFEAVDGNAGG